LEDARRAEAILRLAAGESYGQIRAAMGCSLSFLQRWKGRFERDRLSGLYSDMKVVRPSGARLHSKRTRRLAAHLGTDHMMMARVWFSLGD
jgi:transposase